MRRMTIIIDMPDGTPFNVHTNGGIDIAGFKLSELRPLAGDLYYTDELLEEDDR